MTAGRLGWSDYAMGVGVAFVWGMGFVFAKAAIEHFPPILLMAFRFLLTALLMVWFVRPPIGMIAKIFGIAFISAAIQYSLTFTGLKGLDASIAALIVQLEVPFLVILAMVLLKERPGLRKWLGIALAFGGIALIAGEPRINNAWVSLLLVVGGAFTWALGQVLIRTLKSLDGLTAAAWVAVCATPQLFIMSALIETGQIEAIRQAGWVVWSAVVYLGVVMTAIGYAMWYTLVRRHPVSLVSPFLLLLPVFAAIGGTLFLGETMSLNSLLGGAVVIAGVAVIVVERPADVAVAPVEAGYFSWDDGSSYQGEWLAGVMHGSGRMTWGAASPWPGLTYEGEWHDGKPFGRGVYTTNDGQPIETPGSE